MCPEKKHLYDVLVRFVQKSTCMVCRWGLSRKEFVWYVSEVCPEKHLFGMSRKTFVWCVSEVCPEKHLYGVSRKAFVWCVQKTFVRFVQKSICVVCPENFCMVCPENICMACPEKHLYGLSVKVKSGEIEARSICHPMLQIFNLPEILKNPNQLHVEVRIRKGTESGLLSIITSH